ncbi:MAG: CRTAC1 family protein [Cyanobacteria bacterium P01_D01_bin.1]
MVSLAVFALVAAIALSFFLEPISIKLGAQFESVPIKVADYDLNDIGVADINQDGNLDIFTTNHSSQQSLLIGDGDGNFVDRLVASGLSQDREFPGLENSVRSPQMNTPGLYIYRQRNHLHLAAKNTEAFGEISGSIELSANVELIQQAKATVELEKIPLPSGITASRMQFNLSPGGVLEFESKENQSKKLVIGIFHRVQVEEALPLSAIFIGQDALTPNSHSFELLWRDRHSMIWSDINTDGQPDVFIGRGGIHGKMRLFPERYYDELFISKGNVRQINADLTDQGNPQQSETFEDQTALVELFKDDCAARQSAWVDFDRDGRLDIFNSCGRNASDKIERPHQLFHQQADGAFEDIAESVNLNLPRAGEFVWFDANNDSRPDLVATQDKQLTIYYNQGDTFRSEPLGKLADHKNKQFTVADFDRDGSSDVYISGKAKSYLLQKQNDDSYQLEDPAKRGLPDYSLCANWVDYDNDGYIDLHTIPGGLYRQQPNQTFKRTQLLSNETAILRERLSRMIGWRRMKQRKARCSWLDYNNDGFRDLLFAQRRDSPLYRLMGRFGEQDSNEQWQVRLFKNKGVDRPTESHWLSLVLKGAEGNLEAIGAAVSVETPEGSQTQLVGGSEGSYFSQGHYQVYFGLGTHQQASVITVKWPNGESQVLRDVAADQRITVEQFVSAQSA